MLQEVFDDHSINDLKTENIKALDIPPAFHFPQNPSPQSFETIRYQQGGQMKQTSLNEFLRTTQTTSFIVIKDGAILDESYANGFTRDSIVTSFSIAKSFTSALVGIAVNKGYIGSVDDRMVTYLPELRGRDLDNVTIRDLLTMSAGVSYRHDDEEPILLRLLGINDDARDTNFPDLTGVTRSRSKCHYSLRQSGTFLYYRLSFLRSTGAKTINIQSGSTMLPQAGYPLGVSHPSGNRVSPVT